MNYRPEIDGLRAVAVIPVIFFHAGFNAFSGGFVGVDVFFVISGFLITSILINDIENNRFSIVKFYERRARRILPALLFMIAICIFFAWLWTSPRQMQDFSHSLIAVGLFVSNILFWRQSDYFEPEAEENPLLHTWSLSVEEQYYIIFPIFLIFAWKFGRNKAFYLIFLCAVISLLLSEWGWRNQPSANFYLAPTRAWELLAGSMSAFIVQNRGPQSNNFLSLIGFFAIAVSIFLFNEDTPFPSIYTLIPVGGTVLLVIFAGNATWIAKILSVKIVVGIGLISYSAYLWHQPIFVFARLREIAEPSFSTMFALSIVSFIIAAFSWKFIEQPFRKTTGLLKSQKSIFILSFLGLSSTIGLGYIGHMTNGFASMRYSEPQLAVFKSANWSPFRNCDYQQKEEFLNKTACNYFKGTPKVAVMGNSHATELAHEVAKSLEPYEAAIAHYSIVGCKHNYNVIDEKDSFCQRWHNTTLQEIKNNSAIETVILSYRNEYYLDDKKYRKSLVDITNFLLKADKKVFVVFQAPFPGSHIDNYIRINKNNFEKNISGISRDKWVKIYKGKHIIKTEFSDKVVTIDPADYFCQNTKCDVIKNKKALYFDDDHMSLFGASIIAQDIANILYGDSKN